MRVVAMLLLVGCYAPSPQAGAPCSPDGTCPASLVCTGGYCLHPGAGVDALDDATVEPDAELSDAPIDAPPSMGWAAPLAIPELNTGAKESDPTLSGNLLTIVFVSQRQGGLGGDDLWMATRQQTDVPWEAPTNITDLNTASDETSPEISGDGQTLYFLSSRNGVPDVFVSQRGTGGAWGVPALVNEFNTAALESGIAVSPNGLAAIVDRGAIGSRTLHYATRASTAAPFGTTVPMTVINTTADPSSPTLTNGGNTIYFHADNPRNIYVTTKQGNSWTTPIPVGEVNTTMREAAPFILQGDDVMVFERENNLYYTTR